MSADPERRDPEVIERVFSTFLEGLTATFDASPSIALRHDPNVSRAELEAADELIARYGDLHTDRNERWSALFDVIVPYMRDMPDSSWEELYVALSAEDRARFNVASEALLPGDMHEGIPRWVREGGPFPHS